MMIPLLFAKRKVVFWFHVRTIRIVTLMSTSYDTREDGRTPKIESVALCAPSSLIVLLSAADVTQIRSDRSQASDRQTLSPSINPHFYPFRRKDRNHDKVSIRGDRPPLFLLFCYCSIHYFINNSRRRRVVASAEEAAATLCCCDDDDEIKKYCSQNGRKR